MTASTNYFEKLSKLNVTEHIEKKGKFSYLSWPYAVQQLGLADPSATWEVVKHEGLPYLKTEYGVFVEVSVTVQGVKKTQIHPVLDGRNQPITKPTAFDINTSIQRCLVKAIGLHGLGLYIYAGEDLPEDDRYPSGRDKVDGDKTVGQIVDANIAMEKIADPKIRRDIKSIAKSIETAFYEGSAKDGVLRWQKERAGMSEEERDALWESLQATVRNNLKKCEEAMGVTA